MGATYSDLGSIRKVTDTDTSMYMIGEIDGGFDEVKLKAYIEQYGSKGVAEIMSKLSYMHFQLNTVLRSIRSEDDEPACKADQ